MKKVKILNLGCGQIKGKDEIGIDIDPNSKADIIHDLNKFPYPFEDNEFDRIIANHVLEHLGDYERVLKELHRIIKNNGEIIIRVPHFSSVNAYSTRVHKWYFGAKLFLQFSEYFEVEEIKLNYTLTNVPLTIKKRIVNLILSRLANSNIWFCERIWCYYVGGFSEIYVKYKAKK